jgi:hemerythrin superfamily protein
MSLMDTLRGEDSKATTVPNALDLLKQDHDQVSDLLQEFEKGSGARQQTLARQICAALTVHAQIEEEIFYPAARGALSQEDQPLLDEADVEHATIKGLVGRIESDRVGDHFDAFVKVLGEYVKHHVKEEEGELFPKVRSSDLDLDVIGAKLAERKRELMREPR